MRRLWSLCGSIRNSGGVIRKGVLALSGVERTSPVSIHASTSAGRLPALLSRTVTSPCPAGNTTRVPPITTLA